MTRDDLLKIPIIDRTDHWAMVGSEEQLDTIRALAIWAIEAREALESVYPKSKAHYIDSMSFWMTRPHGELIAVIVNDTQLARDTLSTYPGEK